MTEQTAPSAEATATAAALDALPRYSVVVDNNSDQTWVAVGRIHPRDCWWWHRLGDGDGPAVAASSDLVGFDLVVLAEGLTETHRLRDRSTRSTRSTQETDLDG